MRNRAAAVLCLALLAGCAPGADRAAPAAPPPVYDGPLVVAPDPALQLWNDPGAAGRVVSCDQPVLGGSEAEPIRHGEVRETPDAALREARDEGQWSGRD